MTHGRDRTLARAPIVRGLGFAIACASMTLLLSTVSWAAGPNSEPSLEPRQRYGFVALSGHWQQTYDTAQLNAGWYVDFSASAHCGPAGMDPALLISIHDGYTVDAAALGPLVDYYPAATWLIGNEPDDIWQDNIVPEEYARIYSGLYAFIKDRDPTAQVAAGGIVQPTPLRLEYLDLVLNGYHTRYGEAMPVDVWHIHNAILNEVSCVYNSDNCWGAEIPPGINAPYGEVREISDNDNMDMFRDQIWAFRQWMTDRGYTGYPLIVTEYGILMPADYGFSPDRVNSFMSATFSFFENAKSLDLGVPDDGHRLVQRWAWFSLNDDSFNGNLFNPDTAALTAFGQSYRAHTATLPPLSYVDLAFSSFRVQPVDALASPTQTITRSLDVRIANVGTAAAEDSFAVALAYTGPVSGALGQIVAGLPAQSAQWLTFTLADLPAGSYRVSLEIDPANQVAESLECNNTASTVVLAPTDRVYLPVVAQRAPPAVARAAGSAHDAAPLRLDGRIPRAVPHSAASSSTWEEFAVPAANSYPAQIAVAEDGGVWISERDANKIARFDPETHGWLEYEIPIPDGKPWGIALDSAGNVWVAESAAGMEGTIRQESLVPEGMARTRASTLSSRVYLPIILRLEAQAAPDSIVMLDVAGGTFQFVRHDLTAGSEPWDVTAGQGGDIWFSEKSGNKIGRLVAGSGALTEYPVTTEGARPAGLDYYGGYVYFTESGADRIARLRTDYGLIAEAYRGEGSQPQDVAVTPNGGPWFAETGANRIFLLDPSTLSMGCAVPVRTPDSEPYGIATDGNALIWFTERAGNKLGLYQHPRGRCTYHYEFALPTPNSLPTGIAVDAEGCVWYTAPGANQIGRFCLVLSQTYLPLVSRSTTP